ncbi:predicted protein [Chaetoceros tenuissimus]|uniref:MYND-type domain-containing protein n=1 Tax=Chaetoceros tenuissimus TaxID=426638 RepID=A0AAD3HA73_9STRA|nr:predicted protein [Chaetoceros tenuissimus]
MGKKGKRSRRKAVTAADRASIVALQTKIDESIVKINESGNLHLYSEAVDELRALIQLIETEMLESSNTMHEMKNLQSWFFETKMIAYSHLMMGEFDRHNFDDAIQIYKEHFERRNIDMNMKVLYPQIPSLQLKYHEALLRQGKGSIDTFISLSKSLITHGRKDIDDLEIDLYRYADFLRTIKKFDAAIVLGKQLEALSGDRLSLATTYLEQYIVGDKSLPKDVFLYMKHVLRKHEKNRFYTVGSMLMLAQLTYLFHQFYSNTEVIMRKAIGYVEEYLDCISKAKIHCITCNQTATESDVQFVCSGCRVACYCSIDHQRMTWKKEAEKGMRFGHEILCPVMKAYRKWRHAHDNGDNDRVSRLRRRFERECLYCLSDSLGLRDKCF